MMPIWLQPWMIKGGAVLALLGIVFAGGCRVQKSIDIAKIQRINTKYDRCVGIVDTFQLNVDTLEQAIKDNNAKVIKLGEEYNAKVISMQSSHDAAIRRLNTSNDATIKQARDEAAALRERMVRLSVAESCTEAMKAIAQ